MNLYTYEIFLKDGKTLKIQACGIAFEERTLDLFNIDQTTSEKIMTAQFLCGEVLGWKAV